MHSPAGADPIQKDKSQRRDESRSARFLKIRDALLAASPPMRPIRSGISEITVGPFMIVYAIPGAMPGRAFNMQIWPAGEEQGGHILHGDKVANVDWDQSDNVAIISFESGAWERELLDLLAASGSVGFIPRR